MVYVIFAAMLIVVAIANIFGQSDSYAIKKMLPRFIIGVIMVPFTWWIVSASLSVSSYLTALVIRMPADTIMRTGTPDPFIQYPWKCLLDFRTTDSSKIFTCQKDDMKNQTFSKYLLQSQNAYGIIPLYAYNIFKIDDLDRFKQVLMSQETKETAYMNMTSEQKAAFDSANASDKSMMLQVGIIATAIGKIAVQLSMSVLFAIVFIVILIALVLVLFTRVIRMWMYAIFSPLFALKYFLSDKVDKDSMLSKFDFREFIGLAMVPVVVSAALGFGFMFLNTFQAHLVQSSNVADQKWVKSDYINVTQWDNTTNGSIQFFGTTITIFLPENSTQSAGGSPENNAKSFQAALFNVLAGLITPILGLVILWMAVMAAMKTSAATKEAVKGIEWFGDQIAGMTKKLPGFLPVPGMKVKWADGKEKAMSFKHVDGLLKSFQAIPGQLETSAYNDVQRTWFNKNPFEDITNKIKWTTNHEDAARMLLEEMKKSNTWFNAIKDVPAAQQALIALGNKIVDPTKKAAFDTSINAGEFKKALVDAFNSQAFTWINNQKQIGRQIETMSWADSDFEKVITLLGWSSITINAFKGVDSLSRTNRKFKLKKEYTTNQQEKDLEIKPEMDTVEKIKTYIKSHIPNISDTDLDNVAQEIFSNVNRAP